MFFSGLASIVQQILSRTTRGEFLHFQARFSAITINVFSSHYLQFKLENKLFFCSYSQTVYVQSFLCMYCGWAETTPVTHLFTFWQW